MSGSAAESDGADTPYIVILSLERDDGVYKDVKAIPNPPVFIDKSLVQVPSASQSNKAIAVFNFGSTVTATNGDFTVVFPTADASNAVIRIT